MTGNSETKIRSYTAQGIEILLDVSDENVFHPYPITHLLANAIKVQPKDTVLEVGCGSGFIAMIAAKLGAKKVYASDIATPAVRTTMRNLNINSLNGRVQVKTGDLFEPFQGCLFDLIISNPPCMPFPPRAVYRNDGLSSAVNGGIDGTDFTIHFLQSARYHLKPDGKIYVPLPKWSHWRKIYQHLETYYRYEIVATEKVSYYLANYDHIFMRHFETLLRNNYVEAHIREGRPEAEIAIVSGKLKNKLFGQLDKTEKELKR